MSRLIEQPMHLSFVLALSVGAFTACDVQPLESDTDGDEIPEGVQQAFEDNCALSGCHSGGSPVAGLSLEPAQLGAIIGGNMGANFGAGKKAARMEDEALRKQGISKEMVQMVTEVAQSLANAEDALKTAKESLKFELEDTLSLEAEANELYNMASAAVQSGDDDTARKHLTERKRVEAKMEDAKRRAAEAKGRVQRVEQSVESLASQAKKLESVLKENMANAAELNAREAAAKFQDAMTPSVTELELDDPLERKFRELEGR